jgi:nitrite reductase (NO-forming)
VLLSKPPNGRRPAGLFTILASATAIWTILVAGILGIGSAIGDDPSLVVLGERTVLVELSDFDIKPDVIQVAPYTQLTFVAENIAETQHDLTISEELSTGRLKQGEQATLEAGVVTRDFMIWCAIKGHREQGMEARVQVVEEHGSPSGQ